MIIQIVPAIDGLYLHGFGYWEHLSIDFIPGLNIITGGCGCGKSIILRSILHTVHPSAPSEYSLTQTLPKAWGQIGVGFYRTAVTAFLPALAEIPEKPDVNESFGQFILSQLRSYIDCTTHRVALLIEDEVVSSLDDVQYRKAVELLNIASTATCQIICVIGRRFSLKDFPHARVHKFYKDTEDIAHIELIQEGRVPTPSYETNNDNDRDSPEESMSRPDPVAPPSGRLIVKRDGHSITRQIPKPIVLVDTRERYPFQFSRFPNWIAEEKRQALKAGDYSIEGMETLLILERKTLTGLITTVIQQRTRFFKQCEKMTKYRWRAVLIEASYEDVKSPYDEEYNTSAHPNAVSGTLDALEARFGIPVIYTSLYRPLAEEKAASWLSKHFTYWYLETNGFGRILQEGDL